VWRRVLHLHLLSRRLLQRHLCLHQQPCRSLHHLALRRRAVCDRPESVSCA
jgi:hypothetical protein